MLEKNIFQLSDLPLDIELLCLLYSILSETRSQRSVTGQARQPFGKGFGIAFLDEVAGFAVNDLVGHSGSIENDNRNF